MTNIIDITLTQPVKNPGVIDHNALKLAFHFKTSNKGPGYWKLNNQILSDPVFVDNINGIIEDVSDKYNNLKSYQLLWEFLKVRIKEFATNYCKINARDTKKSLRETQEQLDDINKKIQSLETKTSIVRNQDKILENYLIKKQILENKINDHYKDKAKGHCIRA